MAAPATAEETTSATSPLDHFGQPCSNGTPRSAPNTPTSAAVAAKDIWKPGDISVFGPVDQHDDRRDGDRTQRDRAPVEQYGDEHHRDLDEGTFGRDIAAREREVEGPCPQRTPAAHFGSG